MDSGEFEYPFLTLGRAFDKVLKPEVSKVYYDNFRELSGKSWTNLCQWAVVTLERFPPIAVLWRAAYEQGMVIRTRHTQETMVSVVCDCGSSFATPREGIENLYTSCKASLGGTCDRTFTGRQLLSCMDDQMRVDFRPQPKGGVSIAAIKAMLPAPEPDPARIPARQWHASSQDAREAEEDAQAIQTQEAV